MKLIGADTGGTFTDLVLIDETGAIRVHKVLSTPDDPSRAVIDGISGLIDKIDNCQVVHGSTVATNAILERKGVKTALITTSGFEDVIEIGRQARPALYDLVGSKPEPLIPAHLRFGLNERILFDGSIAKKLKPEDIQTVLDQIRLEGIESLAVCLLHAYANPEHEKMIEEQAEILGLPVSVSHKVLNEFREYERTSTTVINAYVAPLMARYLAMLEQKIGRDNLRIMQSNGGSISAGVAVEKPVRTILSGPAGGVIGAGVIAQASGLTKIITFDMGGTSTDVSLYNGAPSLTTETVVAGNPVRVPMIDIHTVGAGGGSLAAVDAGGALNVGPESAGADPGPVCYGQGDGITVTDANLFAGRLSPSHFLGGRMKIFEARVAAPMAKLAESLELSAEETAEGVIRVVNATMEKALRVISVERGIDPKEYTLVSFGGAGSLHAADLARALGMLRVLVPPRPGVLSALGMILSDVVMDWSQTIMRPADEFDFSDLTKAFEPLLAKGRIEMEQEGFSSDKTSAHMSLDMRYLGQSYEITVPFTKNYIDDFHAFHKKLYGSSNPAQPMEVVTLRLKMTGLRSRPNLAEAGSTRARTEGQAKIGQTKILSSGQWLDAGLYHRDLLRVGDKISGPALVVEFSATTWLPPDFTLEVDPMLNMIIEPRTEMS